VTSTAAVMVLCFVVWYWFMACDLTDFVSGDVPDVLLVLVLWASFISGWLAGLHAHNLVLLFLPVYRVLLWWLVFLPWMQMGGCSCFC
jgi:hypothetical protein